MVEMHKRVGHMRTHPYSNVMQLCSFIIVVGLYLAYAGCSARQPKTPRSLPADCFVTRGRVVKILTEAEMRALGGEEWEGFYIVLIDELSSPQIKLPPEPRPRLGVMISRPGTPAQGVQTDNTVGVLKVGKEYDFTLSESTPEGWERLYAEPPGKFPPLNVPCVAVDSAQDR